MHRCKKTKTEVYNFVVEGLNGFLIDPPETDYQRGYLLALKTVKDFMSGKFDDKDTS